MTVTPYIEIFFMMEKSKNAVTAVTRVYTDIDFCVTALQHILFTEFLPILFSIISYRGKNQCILKF